MREIFELQDGLNEYIFRKRNLLPWPVVRDNPELNTGWIFNFRNALSAEVCELYESAMAGDLDNAKIELIDILHFLVSLSLIVGVGYRSAEKCLQETMIRSYDENVVHLFLALDRLQGAVHWKWWSDSSVRYYPMRAKLAVRDLWARWWNFACHLYMSPEQIKEIYMAKNKVNYERQINGYSVETKTENDNKAIIAGMSKSQERRLAIQTGRPIETVEAIQ